MFAYGLLSVVLALYLAAVGLSETQIGLLLTLTLLGDAAISLWMTSHADRSGRRKTLLIGAALMIFAGVVFALTSNVMLLIAAAIIGVISPSGSEVGPFLSIEQASLTQLIPDEKRTQVFAWYNLVGAFATAVGALVGGGLAQLLQRSGVPALDSYRVLVIGYGVVGLALLVLFTRLSHTIEVAAEALPSGVKAPWLGLHQSRNVVLRLSALFAMDAFGGAFVLQSFVAYWFHVRYGVEPALLGAIFFGANILAGISALSAAKIAARFGLINTMVFTHIPSNMLLILVPLMPTLPLAIVVLLARFSISQMDVPTRQSYTVAVVHPSERSAAAGVTGIARSIGASVSPLLAGLMLRAAGPWLSAPFFVAGGVKILYDLALYRSFNSIKPPEESAKSPA